MRRFVLSAVVLVVFATTAGAVVQGYPDEVYLRNWSITGGAFAIDDATPSTTFGAATLGQRLNLMEGVADSFGTGFQFGAGTTNGSVLIEARWSSPQTGFQSGRSPNFVIYLGDADAGSAVSVGTVAFTTVTYDTIGTFVSWGNTTFPQFFTPPPYIWSASLNPVTYSYSFPGTSSPVYGIQMLFTVSAPATFYIDAMQNPEPGTLALFALGAGGLGCVVVRRRRRKKKA